MSAYDGIFKSAGKWVYDDWLDCLVPLFGFNTLEGRFIAYVEGIELWMI